MQKLLSVVRRCVDDYEMIGPGDNVAVGVSGGKDSLTLLYALSELRKFHPNHFTLTALTLDLGLGADYGPIERFCSDIGVEYRLRKTQIAHVVFDERKETNPCSMCSKMRRGALNEFAKECGCSKIALGHHFDDAVETFMLSLIFEGRFSCFEPVTYLSRSDITQIRPLLYLGEGSVAGFARRYGLPVVKNPCPADTHTKRQEAKELLSELNGRYPGLKSRIFSSMQRLPLSGWKPLHTGRGRKCDVAYPLPDGVRPDGSSEGPDVYAECSRTPRPSTEDIHE